jgi:hypothetical protein
MVVASGGVTMELDLNRLNRTVARAKGSNTAVLHFDVRPDEFFSVLVFNDQLRAALPGAMALAPQDFVTLPQALSASYQQLAIESTGWGAAFELVVRDARTGFVFFNIDGHQFGYEPKSQLLTLESGRLRLSPEFAAELGRPSEAGTVAGKISLATTMRPIEVTEVVNGEVRSDTLPALNRPESGTTPGPDVVVGDLFGLTQFGTSGTQVGLAVGTSSCNFGTENLHWFEEPDNDHPLIPQNLYRMSGGATNDVRFEQIGQSSVKHAFEALAENICGLGCNGVSGTNLGSGCSDPYTAGLNSGPNLGSRAWINPFSGAYPRSDTATPPNNHSGHTHNGISHRVLVEVNDLNTSLNPGATYYAEAIYITPHEYAWCQTHPGQCNMYNNASYRRYAVTGTASPFNFSPVGATVRQQPAIVAWTGSTQVRIEPAPGADGIGVVAYKITNPSAGVWHYEYAIYNQNLDRSIQSFAVPVGAGVTLSNIGFHAPPQHPGWAADGTVGSAGFSSTPWASMQAGGAITWNSETLAQNPNANAIRWGTLYNFRFDSNRPPEAVLATIGFFKTGAPITVAVQGPSPAAVTNVTVSGRVLTAAGNPLHGAAVIITDQQGGNARRILSSSLGYYTFDNVAAGGTYTITVSAKRYTFTPQTMQVNDNVANVDFVAQP